MEDKTLRELGSLIRLGKALIPFVMWAYGQWVVFEQVLAKVPMHFALVWAAVAAAAMGAALFFLFWLIDRHIAYRDGRKRADGVAKQFDELRVAGVRQISLGEATAIWHNSDPTSLPLVRLRYLKFAVKQNLLVSENWKPAGPMDFPGKQLLCRPEALAAFIRARGWLNLVDKPDWPLEELAK